MSDLPKSATGFVPLPRSLREPLPGSEPLPDPAKSAPITLTLGLRSKADVGALDAHVEQLSAIPPAGRMHLGRAEFADAHGADPADVAAVEQFAHDNGLTVLPHPPGSRSIQVTGPGEAVELAFGTKVIHLEAPASEADGGADGPAIAYRSHTGHLHIPDHLDGVIEAAIGFDTRPYARPKFRLGPLISGGPGGKIRPHDMAHPAGFTGPMIRKLYGFDDGPFAKADGEGQVVGIIELASPHGSGYRAAELNTYFKSIGVSPPPLVVSSSVDGAHNAPGTDPDDPQCADGEVALDNEVAAGIAPKAKLVNYFAPNTAKGFVDAINAAVHDDVNKPTVISLSWGGPEDPNDPANDQIHQILMAAAAMGITFCVASGDNGSDDAGDGTAAVDFPASSPYALACGGLKTVASGPTTIESEKAWGGDGDGASGGGVSRVFPVPSYQAKAGVPSAINPSGGPGRGVPDVSGPADPATGWDVFVDGRRQVIGGTSAVAPMWAGIVALTNQVMGHPVGFINPIIYQHPEAFRDVTAGTNGDYHAGPGWDACTGLGSPIGPKLLAALQGSGSAGSAA